MALPKKSSKTLPVIGRYYDIVTKIGEGYSNMEFTALTNAKSNIREECFMEQKQYNPRRFSLEDVESWSEKS